MKEKILISTITFILGIFIKHIWDKFKNRISELKYTVWHRYLGGTIDDSRFGSLKLLYNDKPIKNLYMSTILLSNESNRDLSDLELNIICDSNSAILISYGKNRASLNELLFTDKYNAVLVNRKPEDLEFIFKRRDYKLPVLNRGDKVDVTLLTTNNKGIQPVITISCDYPGVKMKYAVVLSELFGESQRQSALLGIIVALLLCIPIIMLIPSKIISVLITLFISIFASLIGVMLIKFYKWGIRILS